MTRETSSNGSVASSFGDQLRTFRELSGLTQEELAERAGLSRDAISALERGRRRHPHPPTIRALADAMKLSDEDRRTLLLSASSRPVMQPKTAPGKPSRSLPAPLTALVGRTREREEILTLLQDGVRLITLTGPGGVGKTRLAKQVALDFDPSFTGIMAFVPLEAVSDASVVLASIAESLGARDLGGQSLPERLQHVLASEDTLLVLDNLEHLGVAFPVISELLSANPRLQILATSRTTLRLHGEHEFPVVPFGTGTQLHIRSAEDLTGNDAVALFVERARAAEPRFSLTTSNAATVAAICTRLDGLPLAIELAAARLKVLTPEALLGRLDSSLDLLSGGARDHAPRLQSIRATISWSYDLLESWEQRLFRQLSVFSESFTVEAAEALAGPFLQADSAWTVLDGIASLLDKSLVQRQGDLHGEPRFSMLQTIREFGREELTRNEERKALRAAHAKWYSDLAERGYAAFRARSENERWLNLLEAERSNIRAALSWWDETGNFESLIRTSGFLYWFWYLRGSLTEARQWLERSLSADTEDIPNTDRVRAMVSLGQIAHFQGDDEQARIWSEASVLATPEGTEPWARGAALVLLGIIAEDHGDYALAELRFAESLVVFRSMSDTANQALALQHLGVAAWGMGDVARALGLCREAVELQRRGSDTWGLANTLGFVGLIATEQGAFGDAAVAMRECLDLRWRAGAIEDIAGSLSDIAVLGSAVGQAEGAARLLGATAAMRMKNGRFAVNLPERAVYEHAEQRAREVLGSAEFAMAYEEGHQLERDDALGEAFALIDGVIGSR